MKVYNTLFGSSKFPLTRKRISSKFINSLGTSPRKSRVSLGLVPGDGCEIAIGYCVVIMRVMLRLRLV